MTGDPSPPDAEPLGEPRRPGHVGPSRGVIIALVVLIVVFVVGFAAVIGYWVLGRSDSGGSFPATVSTPTDASISATPAPAGGTESTTTGVRPSGSSSSGAPAVTTADGAPDGSRACPILFGPSGLYRASSVGTAVTTCGFAEQVRRAYAASGRPGQLPRTIRATSPETGESIAMMCAAQGPIVTCNGGEDAVVYLY